jgi:hypothetical protein
MRQGYRRISPKDLEIRPIRGIGIEGFSILEKARLYVHAVTVTSPSLQP